MGGRLKVPPQILLAVLFASASTGQLIATYPCGNYETQVIPCRGKRWPVQQ